MATLISVSHANIIDYCDRPFDSVEQMDEVLIDNWNNTVKDYDKVYVLGDFALGTRQDIISIGRELKGTKILIYGNHDQASPSTYYEAGFYTVSKEPILLNDFAILSHQPIFVNDNCPFINIFAHVHNNDNYKTVSENGACVSVERIDYRPVNLRVIEGQIKKARVAAGKS